MAAPARSNSTIGKDGLGEKGEPDGRTTPPPWSLPLPTLFLAVLALQLALLPWPIRWLRSGAPILTFLLFQTDASGRRVLSWAHPWSLFATVNLTYVVASTSWLLYWVFTATCYLSIYTTSLVQFTIVGTLTRQVMRAFLRQLQFADDKVALFDIPALEIDTEVHGLMVLRGVTLSLSTLTLEVHGVEVGIKLAEDIELAIQTDVVVISLFRKIEIGDCFANVKGGQQEMTVGDIEAKIQDEHKPGGPTSKPSGNSPELSRMKSEMTKGSPPKDSSSRAAWKSISQGPPKDTFASEHYSETIKSIHDTSVIQQCRQHVLSINKGKDDQDQITVEHELRAAICSELHTKPSVPHPPKRSVKVTTLQNQSPPSVRRFMRRLPLLLRALLNPLSYFHPVTISSITATASGRWIETSLVQEVFKSNVDEDSSSDLQRLRNRISAWVCDANFAVQLGRIAGQAQVPVIPSNDINCQLAVVEARAYRALPEQVSLDQILTLNGADAVFVVPTFLLPHHEHIIPAPPEPRANEEKPKNDKASKDLQVQQTTVESQDKDVAAVKMSVRAHLPATMNQELLDFAALLLKASKLVEIEEAASSSDDESGSDDEGPNKLSVLTGSFNRKVKGKLKKALVANDQWIAKLVGKVMRKLQEINGDLGYSGDIPVELEEYRETGWLENEGEKLLP